MRQVELSSQEKKNMKNVEKHKAGSKFESLFVVGACEPPLFKDLF